LNAKEAVAGWLLNVGQIVPFTNIVSERTLKEPGWEIFPGLNRL
jgi:hypothetical protein